MKFKIALLSWLLHHANRKQKSPEFYSIKNRILKKYGRHVCYDVQHIEGKSCHSCDGTGIYVGSRWSEITWGKVVTYKESCYHCYNGWYKRPVWNILSRMEFGKFTFHQPYARSYTKPDNSIAIIEGYIEHQDSNYSDIAAFILFQGYDFKGYWIRYYDSITGFRLMWWLPRNYLRNAIYIHKHGIPKAMRNLRDHRNLTSYKSNFETLSNDDLPF